MNSLLRSITQSFRHAWRGLRLAFRSERSFRIQIAAALIVIAAMLVLPLTAFERVILFVAIASVLVLELLNSTVERMVDLLKPRLHEYVGDIKDLMAGAVLVAAFAAACIGLLILLPHFAAFLQQV